MSRIEDARQLQEVRRRLRNAAVAALAALVFGTTGYMLLTRGEHSLINALYMTVISLTTVGYGEIIPLDEHPWGRVFTMVLLVFGLGVLAYFASTLTAFFVEGGLGQVFWRQRMRKAISGMKEHIIVAGAGVVAAHVVDELRRVKRAVVVVIPPGQDHGTFTDSDELYYVEGDPAEDDVLREAGVAKAMGLVPALDSDRDNVLVILTARQINPIMRIVAMAVEDKNEPKLRRAGADAVVSPPRIGGLRIASEMIRPTVASFLDQMLRDRDRNLRIEEISIGLASPAIGRTVGELGINQMRSLLLLAIVDGKSGRYTFKPDDSTKLEQGSVLVIMGGPEDVLTLRQKYGGQDYGDLAHTTMSRVPERA
ncbi:MAG TPA: NAD-binding protein [Gemmatimonadales bacterium]|nr:NAD-binding protein [Gemmatimonadales bacterium]